MLGVANFFKTVFECDRILNTALYEDRGLFLVVLVLKNSFLLSFCVFLLFFVNFPS